MTNEVAAFLNAAGALFLAWLQQPCAALVAGALAGGYTAGANRQDAAPLELAKGVSVAVVVAGVLLLVQTILTAGG